MMSPYRASQPIARVERTNETLAGRGGLFLFARYLHQVGVYGLLEPLFCGIRKNRKGLPLWSAFKQVFCFLMEGSSRHVSHFDHLAKDEGYAAVLETKPAKMASSHAIKRFFRGFGFWMAPRFRNVQKALFAWRLQQEQPELVELSIDPMVMDNDEALKRHGVQPTYKKKKGFQPLQAVWKGKIVDAVFRGGKKHGNHGQAAIQMIEGLVSLIREVCGTDTTIIIRLDAGFFDERVIKVCVRLGVEVILSGKMYETVKKKVKQAAKKDFHVYDNGRQRWEYVEFEWGCHSWEKKYRTIYTRPIEEESGQRIFEFARPDNVIITTLRTDSPGLQGRSLAERRYLSSTPTIIASHHRRGADELPHRGLKDFGFEELPFKRFGPNMAFYYCMIISFFLHETFKEDVLSEVVPVTSYATTVRRRVIDTAAKIVRKGGQFILKVPRIAWESLQWERLCSLCAKARPIIPALS